MSIQQVADAHYRRSQAHAARVVAAALAVWREVGPAGWQTEVRRVAGLLAAGQLVAAVQAAEYLLAVADEQGMDPASATLVPRALAGTAANGRELTDILSIPAQRATALLDGGATAADAATSGAATLTRIVGNEVVQAGTTGTQIGMVGQQQMTGYVRLLQAPSCGRCAVLAGKWFRWNEGFRRHPQCDCVHVPAADTGDAIALQTNPTAYFNSLSEADQNRLFGASAADAIRGGQSMSRAVATARGSKSGLAVPPTVERLIADKSRDAAIAALTRSGYLVAA